MNDIVIRAEGLGKEFHIGARQERYRTLRDRLTRLLARPRRRRKPERFWALTDVSFEVRRGEVLGIIGRNGAGKSTLLKILSRITEPTCGWAEIRGRVGSLLEVGTGFHPELTGRENVYLNGAILGMRRREIEARFDEIVAFAEVAQFIDTPIKHYSSGMYLRLAFAVAAHLEPEILIVDEVLAVGDAAFRKRCLGKMQSVATEGRTVLFVSHDMHAVEQLCTRALLLTDGRISQSGDPQEVIPSYLGIANAQPEIVCHEDAGHNIRLSNACVQQEGVAGAEFLDAASSTQIVLEYSLLRPIQNLLLGFDLYSESGVHILRTYDLQAAGTGRREAGDYISRCRIPGALLQAGRYAVRILAGEHRHGWFIKGTVGFDFALCSLGQTDITYPGLLTQRGEWTVSPAEAATARPDGDSSRGSSTHAGQVLPSR